MSDLQWDGWVSPLYRRTSVLVLKKKGCLQGIRKQRPSAGCTHSRPLWDPGCLVLVREVPEEEERSVREPFHLWCQLFELCFQLSQHLLLQSAHGVSTSSSTKRSCTSCALSAGASCVWSRCGQAARHPTPVSRGTGVYSTPFQRGRRRWGSWQRAGRRWSDRREADERDIQQRHDNEIKMVLEKKMRDTDSFHLEPMPMWQHWKSADQCVNCALWYAHEKNVRLPAYK